MGESKIDQLKREAAEDIQRVKEDKFKKVYTMLLRDLENSKARQAEIEKELNELTIESALTGRYYGQ